MFTTANTGFKQEVLFGHSSNGPGFFHVECTSIKATKILTCIMTANQDDIPGFFHSCPAYKVSNALPIHYSIDKCLKGTVTKSTVNILNTTIPRGAL